MAQYVFYFWTGSGVSTALDVVHLGSDVEASEEAITLLATHPSCAYVEVWEGDRKVAWSRTEPQSGLRA